MTITRPNHVWAMDITYIPMARGFVSTAEQKQASVAE
jgi:putative transposase